MFALQLSSQREDLQAERVLAEIEGLGVNPAYVLDLEGAINPRSSRRRQQASPPSALSCSSLMSALGVWLALHQDQLPSDTSPAPPPLVEVHALREAVRELLHARLERRPPIEAALDAVNRLLVDAPVAELAWLDRRATPVTS